MTLPAKVVDHLRYMRTQAARMEKSTTRFTATYKGGNLDAVLGPGLSKDLWDCVEVTDHVTARLQTHVTRAVRLLGQRIAERQMQGVGPGCPQTSTTSG